MESVGYIDTQPTFQSRKSENTRSGHESICTKRITLGCGSILAGVLLPALKARRINRIFKESAFKVIVEAHKCRTIDIFKLNNTACTFD